MRKMEYPLFVIRTKQNHYIRSIWEITLLLLIVKSIAGQIPSCLFSTVKDQEFTTVIIFCILDNINFFNTEFWSL